MSQHFWDTLLQYLKANQKVFLALVAHHSPGSPGTTGAKLGISETGEIFGTIGGGIMEYQLIERAKKLLTEAEFQPEIQTLYHRATGDGKKSGLICSGSQTNIYYLCCPTPDRDTVKAVVAALEQDSVACLVIEATGISVQTQDVNLAQLAQPSIQLIQTSGKWQYKEQLLHRKRIAIIGGGHCSLALSRVMAQLDYVVQVFETRSTVATLSQNHYARSVIVIDDYQTVGARIPWPEITCVVVMTTNFMADIRALLGILSFPFPFIGIMGSQAKIATIFDHLRQAGTSESTLSHLYAPVGLQIGSHTPEEIAISIAAQIIQERKGK